MALVLHGPGMAQEQTAAGGRTAAPKHAMQHTSSQLAWAMCTLQRGIAQRGLVRFDTVEVHRRARTRQKGSWGTEDGDCRITPAQPCVSEPRHGGGKGHWRRGRWEVSGMEVWHRTWKTWGMKDKAWRVVRLRPGTMSCRDHSDLARRALASSDMPGIFRLNLTNLEVCETIEYESSRKCKTSCDAH